MNTTFLSEENEIGFLAGKRKYFQGGNGRMETKKGVSAIDFSVSALAQL